MRRRTWFLAGLAAGLVAGARLGRERYDQFVVVVRKVSDNPAVRRAARTVTHKATELTKSTAQAAGDRLPKVAGTAKAGVGKVRHPFSRNGHDPERASVDGTAPYS